MSDKAKYLFGPVPSRRLGLSLGVDIVPLKTCTQNCLYCQLGIDGIVTLGRKPFVPIDDVVAELQAKIESPLAADYITISGSGEPTLNSQMGLLIDKVRQITDIPVAVITNGTLLGVPAVRADCSKADVVLPSLDAMSSFRHSMPAMRKHSIRSTGRTRILTLMSLLMGFAYSGANTPVRYGLRSSSVMG